MDIHAYVVDNMRCKNKKLLRTHNYKLLKKELNSEKSTLLKLKNTYANYAFKYINKAETKLLKSTITLIEGIVEEKKKSLNIYSKHLNKQEKKINSDVSKTVEFLKSFNDDDIIKIGILLGFNASDFITRSLISRELAERKYLQYIDDIQVVVNDTLEQYNSASRALMLEYEDKMAEAKETLIWKI